MNLFISDNFLDTIDKKVSVLQLIRQVAEDDEVIHAEILSALCEFYDYTETDVLEDNIHESQLEDVSMNDGTLYAGGDALKAIFESLFPGDYTSVIESLVNQLEAGGVMLKLDHNCLPITNLSFTDTPEIRVEETQLSIPVSYDTAARTIGVPPFPGDQEEAAVRGPDVASLSSTAIMGVLKFDNRIIQTAYPRGTNGPLFKVVDLYRIVYALDLNPDYLQQVLVAHRYALDPEDVRILTGNLYLTTHGLSILHNNLCHVVEWKPIVAQIATAYASNPLTDVNFNRLGNLVG